MYVQVQLRVKFVPPDDGQSLSGNTHWRWSVLRQDLVGLFSGMRAPIPTKGPGCLTRRILLPPLTLIAIPCTIDSTYSGGWHILTRIQLPFCHHHVIKCTVLAWELKITKVSTDCLSDFTDGQSLTNPSPGIKF